MKRYPIFRTPTRTAVPSLLELIFSVCLLKLTSHVPRGLIFEPASIRNDFCHALNSEFSEMRSHLIFWWLATAMSWHLLAIGSESWNVHIPTVRLCLFLILIGWRTFLRATDNVRAHHRRRCRWRHPFERSWGRNGQVRRFPFSFFLSWSAFIVVVTVFSSLLAWLQVPGAKSRIPK